MIRNRSSVRWWIAPSLLVAALPSVASASGHGPVYGLATPTLGEGGWSLDVAVMERIVEDRHVAMVRPMLGYGITEDLQISFSVPMPLYRDVGVRGTRAMMMMPGQQDQEFLLGWRFHRQGTSVGARFESTAYLGFDYPVDAQRADIATAPGLVGGLVTGYASRTVYAWVGGLYRRAMAPVGASRPGDLAMYSLVLGYRPPFFQEDYPAPDWRLFVEAVGELEQPDQIAGRDVPDTGAHRLFVGPTVLGLYGKWGISGGPMFPVFQDLEGDQPQERVRMVANFTWWF